MSKTLKVLLSFFAILVLIGLAIQLVPVNRQNPPIVTQMRWDTPQTQQLFGRACADCHSNETRWPWYSYVAPVSWLVARDVQEGREKFNTSNLGRFRSNKVADLVEEIEHYIVEGEMPPLIYLPMHPEAVLNSTEKDALIQGLRTTLSKTLVSR